ncbi:MAG TPA: G8 domain-containing protein [Burkholderiaceae bacterium]|nr:G8 domain-containing protein [Burkholderiaceae bacterium]
MGRTDASGLRWSDPATWAGLPPGRSDIVHVPVGRSLLIDQDVDVAALLVHGSVTVAPRDIAIRTAGILVTLGGSFRAGEADRPFQNRLTVTLCQSAKVETLVGVEGKFLVAAEGGTIELNGARRVGWSILADTVFPGGVVLKLTEQIDWRVGERLVVASGGADLPLVEERLVAAVGSDRLRVTLDRPLKHRHLGRNAPVMGALPGTIGKVALLSRDIVVEGDESSDQSNNGACCTIAPQLEETVASAPQPSVARISGVEFRRVGQFNRPGRFPLYWHGNGASDHSALVNCVVHQSYQRGVVMSGSPGVRVTGNVVYRPLGHGFIVDQAEDGASLVTTNLVIRPRVVRYADPAMRAMCEHRPRAVWFALATRPRTVGLGLTR